MKSKHIYYLSFILGVLLVMFIITETFGLFETNNVMIVNSEIGKWNIYINETSVTEETFVVDSITVMNNEKVKDGKIAPGTSGYFDIVIDPTDTDVSIRYDISFDFSLILNSFSIKKIEEAGGVNLIQTDEFTYTNIIDLKSIKEGTTNTIRVYVDWINNEENNEQDSEVGQTKDNYINIPINISVSQYLGEEIQEYVPVEE
ncbi:MAG: hypothetical protein IJO57_03015 [Bacilli bacterium]|nr:hypothetical protein [Bacilli bacterium]